MKKSLFIIFLLFLVFPKMIAGERTEQQMRESAAKVLNSNTRRAASNSELKEFLSLSKLRIYGYDEGGFAIVTTDDQFNDIIGYSTTAFKDSMPCGFRWWLETANSVMQQGNGHISTKASRRSLGSVSPLLTTKWGQQRPFNDELIYTQNGKKYTFVTGCIATALAQVMNYYKYPTSGEGSYSYNINYNNNAFTITFSADFGNSVYDWDNMLDSYESYVGTSTTDVHTQAVAKLMKDCGVAVHMRYSDATHGSSAFLSDAANALKTYFKYDDSTQFYDRTNYGEEEWMNLIFNEIDKGRPVLYAGADENGNNGHAFILHGYDSTGKIYINWGWYGSYDGYFDLDFLTPDKYQLSYGQYMVITKPGNNIEDAQFHTLTITANGKGSVSLDNENGSEVRDGTKTFNLKDGGKTKLVFSPDDGCKIKYVKVNGTDVTSNVIENSYTIENINNDTTVDVEFKEDDSGLNIRLFISAAYIGGSISRSDDLINTGSQLKWRFSNNSSVSVTLRSMQLIDGKTGAEGNIMSVGDEVVEANSSVAYITTLGSGMHIPLTCRFRYEYNGASYTADAVYGETQSYTLTYMVDGVVYKKYVLEEGKVITPEEEPTKEGYTFSGWSDIPSTMPGHDVTITGSFTINKYKLIYMVDGVEYKTYEIEYGSSITPEPDPTREDYTFSGWDGLPDTMPDHDVVVTGTFKSNYFVINGLRYTITSDDECAVIHEADGGSFDGYCGDVVIPERINLNGNEYLVTSIDDYAFWSCLGLNSITIPNSVKSIGREAFYQCSLKFITIPSSLRFIGEGAFYDGGGIEMGIISDISSWCNIQLQLSEMDKKCGNVTSNPLRGCHLYIGNKEITDLIIPDDVTSISDAAFFGCNITSLEIPSSVISIGEKAFENSALRQVEVLSTTPPAIHDNTFSDYSIPLIVPAGSINAYKNAEGWKNFTNISDGYLYKLTYMVDGEEVKIIELPYGENITPEDEPTKEGYTFSGWSEIPETMPANDVTVTGSFIINKYKLTYIVDGEEYKSYEIEYNSVITPEAEPTKEGYTFSGWSDIPETMPASDVTVIGSFERRYDVGNVASLIGFILRGNGGNEDFAMYDMNGDGELNIGDLILILRNVLKNTHRSSTTRAVVECLAPDLTQYTAAQFVLNVPTDVREQDIQLVKSIKQSHQMMSRQIEPGVYAVVVYSLTNSMFTPQNGGIIEVNTKEANLGDMSIQDIVLAKPTSETKRYEYMPVSTSISDVERDDNLRSVYDMKGQKQSRTDGLRKGVYIENGKKIVVK